MSIFCSELPWLKEGVTPFVTFIGSGGKTTLLAEMASSLAMHCSVVVTTTTKIFLPSILGHSSERTGPVVERICLLRDVKRIGNCVAKQLNKCRTIALGSGVAKGKVLGLPPETIEQLPMPSRAVLVEADGARGRDLKLWRAGEPVIPVGSTVVLVLGCSTWETPISQGSLFGFYDDEKHWLGRRLNTSALIEMICHPRGAKSILPSGAWVVLNRFPERYSAKFQDLCKKLCKVLPALAGVIAVKDKSE